MSESSRGVVSDTSLLECGQRAAPSWLSEVEFDNKAGPSQSDIVSDAESMSDVRHIAVKRACGLSDESCGCSDSFITIGRKPKRLRVLATAKTQLEPDGVPDKLFEVYIVSKEDLPKQIGLAKLLQFKGIKGILSVKFMGPRKVRIQFNSKDDAEKLLASQEFNNETRRSYWSNMACCTYGIIRQVELEVEEDEFLKNIEGSEDILSICRLNRLDHDGRWVKAEAIRLCFKGTSLPPYVYAYGCRFKVNQYTFPVTQCSICWKFGHLSRFCPTTKVTCPKCGGEHANCETTIFRCINCKGSHMALDKSCPVFVKE